MVRENRWGAPRIHGELLEARLSDLRADGVALCASSLDRGGHPGTSWKTFLDNHREVLAAMDFFTVPDGDLPAPLRSARHPARSAQGAPRERDRAPNGGVGHPAACARRSRSRRAAVPPAGSRLDLLGRGLPSPPAHGSSARADRVPKPVAERRRRALGRDLPARAARPRHRAKRAAPRGGCCASSSPTTTTTGRISRSRRTRQFHEP